MKLVILSLLFALLMSCALNEEEIKKRDWYLNYGAYYYEGQRYPQAEEMLNKAKEIEPENLKADLMLGFVYHFSGRYKHAETKFTEIIDNNPSNIKAHHGLAINYFQQGNQKRKVGIEYEGEKDTEFTKSLKHFTRAVDNVDSVDWNPVLNYQISLVYTQIGLDHFGYQTGILDLQKKMQKRNATTDAEKESTQKTPENPAQKEKEERLLQQVVEFAQESGKPLEDAFESLAQKHYVKGTAHFSTAIRYLETHDQFLATQIKSLESEIKDLDQRQNFSYEQKHEAKQIILDRQSKIIEARNSSVSAIAMLHFRLQAFDEALETLQRIPKYDPKNPMVHLNTGLTLIRKAQQEEQSLQNRAKDPEYLRTRNDLIESLYLKAQDELNLFLAKQQIGQAQMILMVKNVLSNLENRNTMAEKVLRNNS